MAKQQVVIMFGRIVSDAHGFVKTVLKAQELKSVLYPRVKATFM